jgi:hypothetical protein
MNNITAFEACDSGANMNILLALLPAWIIPESQDIGRDPAMVPELNRRVAHSLLWERSILAAVSQSPHAHYVK